MVNTLVTVACGPSSVTRMAGKWSPVSQWALQWALLPLSHSLREILTLHLQRHKEKSLGHGKQIFTKIKIPRYFFDNTKSSHVLYCLFPYLQCTPLSTVEVTRCLTFSVGEFKTKSNGYCPSMTEGKWTARPAHSHRARLLASTYSILTRCF